MLHVLRISSKTYGNVAMTRFVVPYNSQYIHASIQPTWCALRDQGGVAQVSMGVETTDQ